MNNPHVEQRRPRVLVVEDDPEVREALATQISERGYEALLAQNGREALAVLADERPALILIDLVMPVMSGGELLRALRDDPNLAHIPRVVMTGLNDLMIGIKQGVEVLYKPIDEATLNLVLTRYVRHQPPVQPDLTD